MTSTQRRMEILELLQRDKVVEVNKLAEKYNVTTMTIRRDLALFEKQGLVVTNYGGAYSRQNSPAELNFHFKSELRVEKKKWIAKAASQMICRGDSIIVDSSSTTLQLTPFLQGKKLTIITNCWAFANCLHMTERMQLILAPGEYNENSAGTISTLTIDFFQRFSADIVFMATTGCSIESGATVANLTESDVKRSMMHAGRKRVLLVDSSKFEQTSLVKYADLTEFDYVVTDADADPQYIERMREEGIKVIVASNVSEQLIE